MPTATRKHELTPDPKGRYRPRIGKHWTTGESVRFNLGTDRRVAETRYLALQNLYTENVRANGQNCWSPLAHGYALRIAQGLPITEPPPDDSYADPLLEYGQLIDVKRKLFPSVSITPSDPKQFATSVELNRDLVAGRITELRNELEQLGALVGNSKVPDQLVAGTFHGALDSYQAHIERDGEKLECGTLKLSQRKRIQHIGQLKREHADFPLYSLTKDSATALTNFWRARPDTQRGTRAARSSCKHVIDELFRFFGWLDGATAYDWAMPKGFDGIERKVSEFENERRLMLKADRVYTIDQLALINKHATPFERLLLYVGLNVAGGAAEIGRIIPAEVLFDHKHEYADYLQFTAYATDSYVRMLRPKTGVFGEWWLWPETRKVLEWGLARAKRLGSKYLFCTENGKPFYNDRSNNPQSQFANMWKLLVERVQAVEAKAGRTFPKLPFGTLRDATPSLIRHGSWGGELASLAIAHGKPFKGDNLLECYADRPFGKLHICLRELHTVMAPIFDVVDAMT